MKKLVSIILALVMILMMSVSAFAAGENDDNTTITIQDANGREYVGYQLMTLTTSLKTGEHHDNANCNGNPHKDNCYNYAYQLNAKYVDILKEETHTNAGTDFWGAAGKPVAIQDVTDDQVLKYLSMLSSDSEDAYGTLRRAADRIYRAILDDATITPDTDEAGTTFDVEQGYWLMADVTSVSTDPNSVYSLVMLDTAGQNELVLKPKTDLPTIDKKVQDINDSEDQIIEDNAWHDSADHDMGDAVPFKMTATLPSNVRAYSRVDRQEYKLIFHDTLPKGLTLDENSIKVYMYQNESKANLDLEFKNPQYTITDYSFNKTVTEDNTVFTVGFENIFNITGIHATDITPETVFVVYYKTTLNGNATIGANGNTNEAYLEYSNNPYTDGVGNTETVEATVYTYELVINKVDDHGHSLAGAGFRLSKFDHKTGEFKVVKELYEEGQVKFVWTGLDDGEYKLEEYIVPDGYNAMAPIEFAITANHTADSMTNLDGETIGADDNGDGILTQNIINKTGAILPETGAAGTMWLIFGGTMLVILAAVFMITRKKMSVYED